MRMLVLMVVSPARLVFILMSGLLVLSTAAFATEQRARVWLSAGWLLLRLAGAASLLERGR
jgi:hypothetical protein